MEAQNNNHHDEISKLATDPLQFIKLCWPDMELSGKQQEVLMSVIDNVETFVHAANKTGKTRIAAVIAVWFLFSRTPARVIVTSSGENQLRNVLWTEILNLIHTSRYSLPFQVRDFRVTKRDPNGDPSPQDYLLGQVTRTVESFQGHHLPGDKQRVLAIFDEASGVPDEFYEAAQSWAHRMLVIGNPLSTDNFFYARCRQGDQRDPAGGNGLLRKVIPIDGRDGPNVVAGRLWVAAGREGPPPVMIDGLMTYEEFCRHKSQWNELQRTTRLYGQFYEGKHARLFPAERLDVAMDRRRWLDLQQRKRHAVAMGVDVAAGGRDQTCWTIIDQYGVIIQIVKDTPNTMEIAGLTIRLMEQYNLPAGRVAFDSGGGGKQIADRLNEQGYDVEAVHFGAGADDKQAYVNRRSEMYGILASFFDLNREEGVFCLPPDGGELRAELKILPLRYDSEGRLRLPPKQHSRPEPNAEKSIRQLLGRSPDRADSLALAAWMLERWRHYPDYLPDDLISVDDRDLTPEEYAEMPDELREICELEDEIAREYEDEQEWDDDPYDDWM